ncbi:MAG: 4Fe-4S binding protein [Thermodesulfobacteriota bacterium]
MAAGEIVIDEKYCKGCGYCQVFCLLGCIVIAGEKVSPEGYLLPTFRDREKCKGCGICVQMCPEFAIGVYQIKTEQSQAKKARKSKHG